MSDGYNSLNLHAHGQPLRIEYAWVGVPTAADTVVFVHEGLGSVSLWKDFPQRLCEALGWRGLVYSRPGYGRSTPRPPQERWAPDFLHRQALEVLPKVLHGLGLDGNSEAQQVWLFGHSDGGSIALLYAARHPQAVAGVVALAPHIFVEPLSLASIEKAKQAYERGGTQSDLRRALSRHHADPDSAFWGWNQAWLNPAFANWNIEADIAALQCPLLVVQGEDDEYGTLAQVMGIQRCLPHSQSLVLAACGHSPHKDQPEAVIRQVRRFIESGPHLSSGD